MAHKLTWISCHGKTVVENQRLAGSIQDTRAYRSAVIDVKSRDHHLVGSRVNLNLKFRKGRHLSGIYDVGRLNDENFGKNIPDVMDKIAKDLEDLARRYNSKILYWHVNRLRGIINPDLSRLKIGTRPKSNSSWYRTICKERYTLSENHTIRFSVSGNPTVEVSSSYLQIWNSLFFAGRKITEACLFVFSPRVIVSTQKSYNIARRLIQTPSV